MTSPKIIAVVGMPGSGKSEVSKYLRTKGFQVVRFGDLTDKELKKQNLELNPKNEELIRNKLRKEYGMDIYAASAMPKIKKIVSENKNVVIDGLYSWDEYLILKKNFPNLIVINVFTQKALRYLRLSKREVRPLSQSEAEKRDASEIETMQKGGPIAIADYTVNSSGSLDLLFQEFNSILEKI